MNLKSNLAYLKSTGIEEKLKQRFGRIEFEPEVNEPFLTEPLHHSLSKTKILRDGKLVGFYWEITHASIDFEELSPGIFTRRDLPKYLMSQVKGEINPDLYCGGGRMLAFVELCNGGA